MLDALSERLLEKETVLGQELDELILAMRPGFVFPSKGVADDSDETPGETAASPPPPGEADESAKPSEDHA